MEKEFSTVILLNSIKDTFPYIENTILILDNKLNWWKKNYKEFEQLLSNKIAAETSTNINIRTKFIIYNGPDEIETVEWSGPALEFTVEETSSIIVEKIINDIGNSWEGHRVISNDNKIIVMFE